MIPIVDFFWFRLVSDMEAHAQITLILPFGLEDYSVVVVSAPGVRNRAGTVR